MRSRDERGVGAVVREAAADQRGAGVPGQAVVGDQGVAGEQQAAVGEQVGRAAGGMAREGDGLRAAGYGVEVLVAVEVRAPGTGGAVKLPRRASCTEVRSAAARRRRYGSRGAFRPGRARSAGRPVGKDGRVLLVNPEVLAPLLQGGGEAECGRARPPGVSDLALWLARARRAFFVEP